MRRLTNKLKIGAETGAATIVAPALLAGTGTVAGKFLTETPIVSDAVRGTARGLQEGARKLTSGLDTIEAKEPWVRTKVLWLILLQILLLCLDIGFLQRCRSRLAITGETDAI